MQTEFGLFLRRKILEKSISISKFAEEVGLSRKAVHNLLDGSVEEAKFKTLIKIADVLNIHPMELISAYFRYADFACHTGTECRTSSSTTGDDIGFVKDVTFPDGTMVSINTTFVKKWLIQNTGTVHWQGRSLICIDDLLQVRHPDGTIVKHGLKSPQNHYPLPDTPPNGQIEIAITFTAPNYPSTVISHWKMVDTQGNYCFPNNAPLTCMIKVFSL